MDFGIELTIDTKSLKHTPQLLQIIEEALARHKEATALMAEERNVDALERVVSGLRILRESTEYENREFRALLLMLLFDLAEVHFLLKDYKQSEKEIDTIFKVLEPLIKEDADRFGEYHILAMELSTRILRSRKKTLDMLVKQKIQADQLWEKVNSGVVAATDRLVEALRKVGQLLAASGDYRGAMKFYAEAIKISKKRAGRVTRKEVKMTIEMAEIMMRVGQMRPRAARLLDAILPHAVALETVELEENILALKEMLSADLEQESKWKLFLHNLQKTGKRIERALTKKQKEVAEEIAGEEETLAEEAEPLLTEAEIRTASALVDDIAATSAVADSAEEEEKADADL